MVGAVATVEAVQTSTSTFGVWAIVVVALVCLAVWLVGISVADSMQTRESRRWWQRLHASEPALGTRPWADPFQRPGNVRGAELSAVGQEAADRRQALIDQDAATEPIPAQPAPESAQAPGTTPARARHAEQPALDGAGDFRRDSGQADWRTEAPTRPDLPAQAASAERHAMPTQRAGDADRADRSLAGPDNARQDEDPTQE